ncbi:hypothetical protein [Chryseobacterium sp.]|uniref:hypothetical protein n=1 Tax=Chryseobacterium sp. TaxID=1871047 RepID=UPI000ECDF4DD|nr:hypothetical protein [Chryseobacterium sp.]HCA06390.1 hypothetical protein [Chryseobacterium sp.]
MKNFNLLICIFLCCIISAQKKLPVVKANSNQMTILEVDNGFTTDWNADPNIKLDVYTTSKLDTEKKTIKIKTDIDSASFTIKKGQNIDFIVLLKGKDSCMNRIASLPPKDFSKVKPAFHDTIKLSINEQNTMLVKTILNKTDTLTLNFDTGSSDLTLTRETLKNKIKSSLKSGSNALEIGNKIYKEFSIYPADLSGHGTEGRFGWDLFDGMIVELDYDKGIMAVHSQLPKEVKKDKSYSKLAIKYFNNVFFVESSIKQGKSINTDWYLFDTGYQRTVMLDGPMLKEQGFPVDTMKEIKRVVMKGAQGNDVPVITSGLESLTLGKYALKNIPAQVLSQSRLVSRSRMHILGNEILKRFNVFFDFQNNVVYLKPNKLMAEKYIEQS